jgi:hypothetical protein
MAKSKKAKPAAKKKKPAAKKGRPAAKKPAVADPTAETEAAQLLQSWDDGDVDNAWDVINQLFELHKRLSKQSPLRKRFNEMYDAIETICRENS